jgi:hypothetical protein
MNKEFLEKYFFPILFTLTILILFLSTSAFPVTMIEKFKPYSNLLSVIISDHWKDSTYRHFIPAQIERESNWKEKAELKTYREYGIGLSQITITKRYNNFTDAINRYKELSYWKYSDRFNANYQLHFVVLQDKSNFTVNKKLFSDNINRWAGTLVSYNAGHGTVLNRRSLCKVTEGCDFNLWFGGLDSVQLKTETGKLYGRSLWKMRNDYPKSIIFELSGKYICLLK